MCIRDREHSHVSFWLKDSQLFPVLSTGQVLYNRPWSEGRIDKPILSHWRSKEGIIELSSELNKLNESVLSLISEITITPTIVDPYRLTLFMIDGFEVRTSIRNFAQNISLYPHYVEQAKADGKTEMILNLFDAKWSEEPVLNSASDAENEDTEREE